MKERIQYYDILRGIAIIGVISIHCTQYNFATSWYDSIFTIFWRQSINFSVPLFLALSGFFLATKKTNSTNEYSILIKKQILKILIPFIIWSLIYSGISIAQGLPLKMALLRLIAFQAIGPFYFIFLIIQYYVLMPILQKMANIKGLVFSAIVSIVSCIVIFVLEYVCKISVPLIISAGLFPTWIIFFVLGLYLRNNEIKFSNNLIIVLAILFYFISCAETLWTYKKLNDIYYAVTAVKISSFLYSSMIILLVFKNRIATKNSFFAYVAEISFGIYLSHIFFINYYALLIDKFFPIFNTNILIKQLFLILLTLFSCVIFSFLLKKSNKTIATTYLGQ